MMINEKKEKDIVKLLKAGWKRYNISKYLGVDFHVIADVKKRHGITAVYDYSGLKNYDD